jgi:hypothetical protein
MKQINNLDNKIKIIEQIIILNDDEVFNKIEAILNDSIHRPKPVKLTKEDILQRAQPANQDILEKDVFTQDKVEKMTQKW